MNEFYQENAISNSLIPQMRVALALNQRKIFLYDDVTENSIFECIYYLNKLVDMDNKLGTKPPIDIMINSNGGYVQDGLSLVSLMETLIESGYNIRTTNIGRAFSMGSIIAISGSERLCYRYGRYMIHDISAGTYGTLSQLQENVEEFEHLRNTLYNIIIKRTSVKLNMLKEWHEHKYDKYFSAEEALKYSLVDKII